jgi:hypothetical protein
MFERSAATLSARRSKEKRFVVALQALATPPSAMVNSRRRNAGSRDMNETVKLSKLDMSLQVTESGAGSGESGHQPGERR